MIKLHTFWNSFRTRSVPIMSRNSAYRVNSLDSFFAILDLHTFPVILAFNAPMHHVRVLLDVFMETHTNTGKYTF